MKFQKVQMNSKKYSERILLLQIDGNSSGSDIGNLFSVRSTSTDQKQDETFSKISSIVILNSVEN